MKENKEIYLKKPHKRRDLHREYYITNSLVARDGDQTQDVGLQCDYKKDILCTCRNLNTLRRRDKEIMYYGLPMELHTYRVKSRSYTDIGIGSVRTLLKKKVQKIYLPETNDTACGNSELHFKGRPRRHKGKSFYESKRTSSKCVGGIFDNSTRCVLSEKLSPIIKTVSEATSPRHSLNRNMQSGSNAISKSLANMTTQVEELIDKQEEVCSSLLLQKIDRQQETVEIIKANTASVQTKDMNTFATTNYKELQEASSESFLEFIHDFENICEVLQSDRKSSNDSAKSKIEIEQKPLVLSSKSIECVANTVTCEVKSKVSIVRQHDVSIDSKSISPVEVAVKVATDAEMSSPQESPLVLQPERSSNPTTQKSFDKQSKDNTLSSKPDTRDSKKTVFKIWSKKFEDMLQATIKPSFKKPVDKKESLKMPMNTEKVQEDKEKRNFFFFRKKHKDKEKDLNKKKSVTTEFCEVKDGLKIAMGSNLERAKAETEVFVKSDPMAWVQLFLSRSIESRHSLKVRWNNKMFIASSSTCCEIMNNTHKATDTLLGSKSEMDLHSSNYQKYTSRQKNIKAWMIPKAITDYSRNIYPAKNTKPKNENMEVRISDQKWLIDKSKAFSHKIEVILYAKNIVRCDKKESYLRIDIPKDFFLDLSETSTDDATYQSSDEEVYNVVEYETISDYKRERSARKAGQKVMNNIEVTVSFTNLNQKEPRRLGTMIKPPTVQRDVIIQGSNVCIPKLCDYVDTRLERDRRVNELWKPILKIEDVFSDDESHHDKPRKKKCEFAESYLQEYYRNNAGAGLFSWYGNDSNTLCCLEPVPKSATIMDSYLVMNSCVTSGTSCCNPTSSQGSLKGPLDCDCKKKTRGKKDKKVTNRLVPKDSIEVFKRRRIYAMSMKSHWKCDAHVEIPSCPMSSAQSKATSPKCRSDNSVKTECKAPPPPVKSCCSKEKKGILLYSDTKKKNQCVSRSVQDLPVCCANEPRHSQSTITNAKEPKECSNCHTNTSKSSLTKQCSCHSGPKNPACTENSPTNPAKCCRKSNFPCPLCGSVKIMPADKEIGVDLFCNAPCGGVKKECPVRPCISDCKASSNAQAIPAPPQPKRLTEYQNTYYSIVPESRSGTPTSQTSYTNPNCPESCLTCSKCRQRLLSLSRSNSTASHCQTCCNKNNSDSQTSVTSTVQKCACQPKKTPSSTKNCLCPNHDRTESKCQICHPKPPPSKCCNPPPPPKPAKCCDPPPPPKPAKCCDPPPPPKPAKCCDAPPPPKPAKCCDPPPQPKCNPSCRKCCNTPETRPCSKCCASCTKCHASRASSQGPLTSSYGPPASTYGPRASSLGREGSQKRGGKKKKLTCECQPTPKQAARAARRRGRLSPKSSAVRVSPTYSMSRTSVGLRVSTSPPAPCISTQPPSPPLHTKTCCTSSRSSNSTSKRKPGPCESPTKFNCCPTCSQPLQSAMKRKQHSSCSSPTPPKKECCAASSRTSHKSSKRKSRGASPCEECCSKNSSKRKKNRSPCESPSPPAEPCCPDCVQAMSSSDRPNAGCCKSTSRNTHKTSKRKVPPCESPPPETCCSKPSKRKPSLSKSPPPEKCCSKPSKRKVPPSESPPPETCCSKASKRKPTLSESPPPETCCSKPSKRKVPPCESPPKETCCSKSPKPSKCPSCESASTSGPSDSGCAPKRKPCDEPESPKEPCSCQRTSLKRKKPSPRMMPSIDDGYANSSETSPATPPKPKTLTSSACGPPTPPKKESSCVPPPCPVPPPKKDESCISNKSNNSRAGPKRKTFISTACDPFPPRDQYSLIDDMLKKRTATPPEDDTQTERKNKGTSDRTSIVQTTAKRKHRASSSSDPSTALKEDICGNIIPRTPSKRRTASPNVRDQGVRSKDRQPPSQTCPKHKTQNSSSCDSSTQQNNSKPCPSPKPCPPPRRKSKCDVPSSHTPQRSKTKCSAPPPPSKDYSSSDNVMTSTPPERKTLKYSSPPSPPKYLQASSSCTSNNSRNLDSGPDIPPPCPPPKRRSCLPCPSNPPTPTKRKQSRPTSPSQSKRDNRRSQGTPPPHKSKYGRDNQPASASKRKPRLPSPQNVPPKCSSVLKKCCQSSGLFSRSRSESPPNCAICSRCPSTLIPKKCCSPFRKFAQNILCSPLSPPSPTHGSRTSQSPRTPSKSYSSSSYGSLNNETKRKLVQRSSPTAFHSASRSGTSLKYSSLKHSDPLLETGKRKGGKYFNSSYPGKCTIPDKRYSAVDSYHSHHKIQDRHLKAHIPIPSVMGPFSPCICDDEESPVLNRNDSNNSMISMYYAQSKRNNQISKDRNKNVNSKRSSKRSPTETSPDYQRQGRRVYLLGDKPKNTRTGVHLRISPLVKKMLRSSGCMKSQQKKKGALMNLNSDDKITISLEKDAGMKEELSIKVQDGKGCTLYDQKSYKSDPAATLLGNVYRHSQVHRVATPLPCPSDAGKKILKDGCNSSGSNSIEIHLTIKVTQQDKNTNYTIITADNKNDRIKEKIGDLPADVYVKNDNVCEYTTDKKEDINICIIISNVNPQENSTYIPIKKTDEYNKNFSCHALPKLKKTNSLEYNYLTLANVEKASSEFRGTVDLSPSFGNVKTLNVESEKDNEKHIEKEPSAENRDTDVILKYSNKVYTVKSSDVINNPPKKEKKTRDLRSRTRMDKLREMLKLILTSNIDEYEKTRLGPINSNTIIKDVTYATLKQNYIGNPYKTYSDYRVPSTLSDIQINRKVINPIDYQSEFTGSSYSSDDDSVDRLQIVSRICNLGMRCTHRPRTNRDVVIGCNLKQDLLYECKCKDFIESHRTTYLRDKAGSEIAIHELPVDIEEVIELNKQLMYQKNMMKVQKSHNDKIEYGVNIKSDEDDKLLVKIDDESKNNNETKDDNQVANILQSYEAKKAVLEIYAETDVNSDEQGVVAKLPKFDYDAENDVYNAITSLYACRESNVIMIN